MKPFDDLTRRGKARRLRALALNALDHYDLDVTRVRLMGNMFNCIFRLDTADGTRYVLRVNLPTNRTPAEIHAEAAWLAALRRDAFNVPEPVLNRAGKLVTQASAPGVPEPRQCVVFSWIPGTTLANNLTDATMSQLGALMARLHIHAETFTLPDGCQLKRFDSVFPFNEPFVLLDEAYGELVGEVDRAMIRYALDRVQRTLDPRLVSGEPLRVLHADLHQWNVMVHNGDLYALDFDDTLCGYPVQDIGIALFYFQEMDDYEDLRAAFRRGYERVRPWPEAFPGEVDIWITQRAMDLLNWVIQSSTPEDRAEGPWLLERFRLSMMLAAEALNPAAEPLPA